MENGDSFKERQEATIAMAKNPLSYLSDKEKEAFKLTGLKISDWISLIFSCSEREFIKNKKEECFKKQLDNKSENSSQTPQDKFRNQKKTIKQTKKTDEDCPEKNCCKKPARKIAAPLKQLGKIVYRALENERIVITELSRRLNQQESEEHRIVFCKYKSVCVYRAMIFELASFSCCNCPLFSVHGNK